MDKSLQMVYLTSSASDANSLFPLTALLCESALFVSEALLSSILTLTSLDGVGEVGALTAG